MTKFVPEEEFDAVTKEGFWIADFYTDHCAPCKALDMVISEIMFDNPEINLAKCDVEKSPAYMERFEIGGTPTLFSCWTARSRRRCWADGPGRSWRK